MYSYYYYYCCVILIVTFTLWIGIVDDEQELLFGYLIFIHVVVIIYILLYQYSCDDGGRNACCSAIVQNTTIFKLIMLQELYQHPHRKMLQQIGPLNNVLSSRRWNTLDWWFTVNLLLPTNIYYRLEIILPSIGFYSTVNSLTHSLLFDINWWFYNFFSCVVILEEGSMGHEKWE